MVEDPPEKSKKSSGAKVVVTQKPKTGSAHPGIPDEISPRPARHVAQNPLDPGVNPAKHLHQTTVGDEQLEQIKPKRQPQTTVSEMGEPVSVEKTIEIHKSGGGAAWFATFLAILSLGAVTGVAFLGFQGYQKMMALNEEINNSNAKQQLFAERVAVQLSDVGKLQEEQKEQVAAFNMLKQDISNAQSHLIRLSGDSQWLLSEAHYLSALASERLHSAHDVPTATKQLEAALQKVSQIGDAQLSAVKRVLNQDIQALHQVPIVDKQKLWQRLDSLSAQIVRLPRNQVLQEQPQEQQKKSTDMDVPGWRKALQHSWQEFKSMVKVTHFEEADFVPILDGASSQQLTQAMGLMVEQAKWAVLNGEQTVFDTSLANLQQFTQKYFLLEGDTRQFLDSLVSLQKETVEQNLPDISGSQFALSQAVQNLNQRRQFNDDERLP